MGQEKWTVDFENLPRQELVEAANSEPDEMKKETLLYMGNLSSEERVELLKGIKSIFASTTAIEVAKKAFLLTLSLEGEDGVFMEQGSFNEEVQRVREQIGAYVALALWNDLQPFYTGSLVSSEIVEQLKSLA